MSYDALLIHSAEIFRRDGRVDRLGQPVEPSPDEDPVATYPCRLDEASGGERFGERSRDLVQYSHKLFLPLGAVLFEADRVTVKDGSGAVLVKNADVVSMTQSEGFSGPHHLEAKIDNTKSGEPNVADR